MLRPLTLLALALTALMPACQQEPSGPVLAAGTWVLDREASAEATLPLWKQASSAAMEAEMDALVKPPSADNEKYRRSSTRDLQLGFPAEIAHELELVEVELEVFASRRFELKSKVRRFDMEQSSGTCVRTDDGRVYLALKERDGVLLGPDEMVKLDGRMDSEGRLRIYWDEFLVTVLVHQP